MVIELVEGVLDDLGWLSVRATRWATCHTLGATRWAT